MVLNEKESNWRLPRYLQAVCCTLICFSAFSAVQATAAERPVTHSEICDLIHSVSDAGLGEFDCTGSGKVLHQPWQAAPPVVKDESNAGRALYFEPKNAQVQPANQAQSDADTVHFADFVLRHAVAWTLGKPHTEAIAREEMTALTSLIWRTGEIRDLTGLEAATNLQSLDLTGSSIADLAPLSGLSNLRSLQLDGNSISELGPLSGLNNLNALSLANNSIVDVGPLSGLSGLQSLTLAGNAISDLGPLSNLAALATLILDENSVSSLGALSGLSNLQTLGLADNPISDLGSLPGLPALRTLHLDRTSIEDLGELPVLTNLQTLTLAGNAISELGPLLELTGLTSLFLNDNSISDIGTLSGLSGLQTLSLADNVISNLEPLSELASLTTLRVDENAVEDLGALSGLSNLQTLTLADNAISDLAPLSGLSNLFWLDLSGNSISDLAPLSELSGLGQLSLDGNAISHLDSLSGLTRLFLLTLDDNSISDVSPLSGLTGILALSLSDNEIADLAPLSGMAHLLVLQAANNSIVDIQALSGLGNITFLYLYGNSINDVGALQGLTDLSWVGLWGNEISDIAPLVANPGIKRGDQVYLTCCRPKWPIATQESGSSNPLSDVSARDHLPSLRNRGVFTYFSGADLTEVDLPDESLRGAVEKLTRGLRALFSPESVVVQADMAAVTRLWGIGSGIADLTGLQFATNLTELYLDDNAISNLEPLSTLDNLVFLHLGGNSISSVEPLSGLTSLYELGLRNNDISDVEPLSRLTRLARLDLYRNDVSDPEPLSGLINLHLLNLAGNRISDIEPFSRMTHLSWVYLWGNELVDISPLVENTGIGRGDQVYLGCCRPGPNWAAWAQGDAGRSNPLAEIAESEHIPALRRRGAEVFFGTDDFRTVSIPDDALRDALVRAVNGTYIDAPRMYDSPPLAEAVVQGDLASLHDFVASDAGISNLTGLEFADNLQSLDLADNSISDLRPLSALTNLTELYIEKNSISDIGPLSDLTSLVVMTLFDNEISDIEPISTLNSLRILLLSDNSISDIEPISDLTDLRILHLANNSISNIAPLMDLTNLEQLFLDGNSISEIDALQSLTGLTRLGLSGNAVSDVGALQGLTRLDWLDLSFNTVSDVAPLSDLSMLRFLDLAGNSVADIEPLVDLADLRVLTLDGNPLDEDSINVHLAALEMAGVNVSWVELMARRSQVLLFPRAGDASGRQGFVRVINHSDTAGEVSIAATDDSERQYDALTLSIGANSTVHFNSDDLEMGNSGKGLPSGTGAGQGDWRLDLTSDLDIEVLSYIRTTDGFLTSMHDAAPLVDDSYRVVIFNPGSNMNQVSSLRLINPGDNAAQVTIRGVDDNGESPGSDVELSVAAGAARTLTAADLESGAGGLQGALGDGAGKWFLTVESQQELVVMSLLESPTGHLTNLSTAPAPAQSGRHSVNLFPAAGDVSGRQGFVRVINHSGRAGDVRIAAADDTEHAYDPVTLSIGANSTVHFNSDDLELGNSGKGLPDGTGAGQGDWRLELTSDLDIEVLSYIRTTDGFLTSMHDVAPVADDSHRVVIFNPGSNMNQVSSLRLINPEANEARVAIRGVDDNGASPGSDVQLSVAAGSARTLTAADLESGAAGLQGALGDGAGKWLLTVESDQELVVISLLESPTGHLTNLSTQ